MREFLNKNINVFVFLGLLAFGSIIYFVINDDNGNSYNVEYVDNLDDLNNENDDIQMMLINKEGLLEVMSFDSIEISTNNIYEKVFSLYNEYQNSLPMNYSSPFKEIVLDREIIVNGDKLTIVMNEISGENDINNVEKCLMWTYQILGINEIDLNIGKTSVTLKKDIDVNKIVLSTLGKKQTILISTEKGFIPYTFYHNQDNLSFLIENIMGDKCSYEYVNNVLSLHITEEVDYNIIKYLDDNLKYINIDKYKIIKK